MGVRMVIEIRAQEGLRNVFSGAENGILSVDVEEGTHVASVLEEVGLVLGIIGRITVNGQEVTGDVTLVDGDKIKVWPASAVSI